MFYIIDAVREGVHHFFPDTPSKQILLSCENEQEEGLIDKTKDTEYAIVKIIGGEV